MRRKLQLLISILMVASMLLGASGLIRVQAMPDNPRDETKVPHYFGPYPNWANSPYTLQDVTVEIVGDGAGASAAATVGANGAITGFSVLEPGSGYTSAVVNIIGAGTGAQAAVNVVTSGAVTGISVSSAGAGYVQPSVVISGGGGAGTLRQIGGPLVDRAFATDNADQVFVILPDPLPTGLLQNIQTLNQALPGGSNQPSAGLAFNAYVLHPTANPGEYQVSFDSGLLTVPALADPAVSEVAVFPVNNVAVSAGDLLAFYGRGVPLDIGGGAATVSYPAPAAPMQGATIALNGPDFPFFSADRAYSFAANVIDTSTVTPLINASATAYGGVDAITITNGGSGYVLPTIDFDLPEAPDGTVAKAHAVIDQNGVITEIVIDDPGSGYSVPPNVVIRDGTIYDPINGGTGATAEASLKILSVELVTFGQGYVAAPSVTINDPVGAGATAAAVVNAGSITAITVTAPGSGYITSNGIKKFTDPLPGLCNPAGNLGDAISPCPNSGKYLPLAVPDASGPYQNSPDASDTYEIALVQYRTSFSSSLPGTLVRGYVQLETPANAAISQHVLLQNELLDGTKVDTGYFGVTPPQYLGPVIAAAKDRPVRIVFRNLLPNGSDGDLFLPVDATMMGSGMGPMEMMDPMDEGSVMDMVRNPMCSEYPKSDMCFKDNRATLHLHGGNTPWISDGTPHQWITPANEMSPWPEGVAVRNVPDMDVCGPADDGCQTFYYTNQQSARLLFYHDHSWGITRLNVYAGEAAGYLITDPTEQALLSAGTIPAEQIPLIIQDRTFVPDDAQLALQDPTWDKARWGTKGNFWYHHVYMPAQNPGDPSGMSAYGRWMYGPWFWPPAAATRYGPIANPYYDPNCNLDDPATWQYDTDPFCEPEQIPGTPNISAGMEQFNDTPVVNGVAYPTITLEPKTYRFRVLNAANDRFFNMQWYVGDPNTASVSQNTLGEVIGATEVAFKADELAAAQIDPNVFPTPDTAVSLPGPDWVQIGTEGGFLPAPVVVDGQQVTTWITDPTRFDVGNVDQHSLLLAPAERADVIVDFSQFAGKTLILYNDAPAAFPARVASYDYYTGAPDLSPVGAPTILPGYGPNTRTVMQVKIAANPSATAFDLPRTTNDGLGRLQAAFRHHADGSGVFEKGQHPIIVGQAVYNSAYGTGFAASSNCNAPGSTVSRCDGYVRISDTAQFGFNTLRGPNTKMTIPLQPKAIHDEMNASTFDEFGRMTANLGLEAQPPTPGQQNVTLYPYVNPATELIDATNLPKGDINVTPISSASDGTQIWRITHNGVDTHPIHWHLYDVQVVNRVTWDNIIIPPDATELGWKDTVRIAPLEDTVVALRPIMPILPFEIPNSVRMLNPMMPAGSTAMFNPTDPQGNPAAPIINQLVNFGWEYVFHCHILSHEEMDMMRPVSVALPPNTADGLAWTLNGTDLTLTWNDNSITETSFVVQRMTTGGAWEDRGVIQSPLDQPNTHGQRSFIDPITPFTDYQYRVVAQNTVGYGAEFPSLTVRSTSDPVVVAFPPAGPTNLTAVLQNGPQIALAWTDNANNETGFVVERSVNNGAFQQIATPAAFPGTGTLNLVDPAVAAGNTYSYRVVAVNAVGSSTFSNVAMINIPLAPPPNAPTNLTAVLQASLSTGPRIAITFRDNATNETGFQIWRSVDGGAFGVLTTRPPRSGVGNVAYTDTAVVGGSTYAYYIVALNGAVPSAPSAIATTAIPPAPAAPSNFTGAAQAITATTARISMAWTDNANNESRFIIQRSTSADFTANLFTFYPTANSVSLNMGNLPRGTTYYFRIAAQNVYGTSAWATMVPTPIVTP